VRRYERPIFSLLYRMVRDRARRGPGPGDLHQGPERIGSYNPQFKFSSLDLQDRDNAAIDHLRKRRARYALTRRLAACYHARRDERHHTSAGRPRRVSPAELEARELGGAIEHAIARLRPEYRTCILLRHVEGHSYEEIARILDLPLGTVKTYIHRARNELRATSRTAVNATMKPRPATARRTDQ